MGFRHKMRVVARGEVGSSVRTRGFSRHKRDSKDCLCDVNIPELRTVAGSAPYERGAVISRPDLRESFLQPRSGRAPSPGSVAPDMRRLRFPTLACIPPNVGGFVPPSPWRVSAMFIPAAASSGLPDPPPQASRSDRRLVILGGAAPLGLRTPASSRQRVSSPTVWRRDADAHAFSPARRARESVVAPWISV